MFCYDYSESGGLGSTDNWKAQQVPVNIWKSQQRTCPPSNPKLLSYIYTHCSCLSAACYTVPFIVHTAQVFPGTRISKLTLPNNKGFTVKAYMNHIRRSRNTPRFHFILYKVNEQLLEMLEPSWIGIKIRNSPKHTDILSSDLTHITGDSYKLSIYQNLLLSIKIIMALQL